MSDSIALDMKEPNRRYIGVVLALGILISICHIPVPVDGNVIGPISNSVEVFALSSSCCLGLIKTGLRILMKGDVIKKGDVAIGSFTGNFDRIHKNVERAVDWIKNNKLATVQGLSVAYDVSTHVMTFFDGEYSVEVVSDDKNNRYNIYVNDEDCGTLLYKHLKNCSEEQMSEKFVDAKENAIEEYKKRHR